MELDFDAGKYAPYLWTALALCVLVIGGLAADALIRARKWRREAERLQAAKDARKAG